MKQLVLHYSIRKRGGSLKMTLLEQYGKELKEILPAGTERALEELDRYDKPSEYLFHSQSNMRFLEDLLRTRFKSKTYGTGFVYGLFAVDHYPKSYLLLALADNIVKESIIAGTHRYLDGLKVDTLVLTDNLLINYRERGNYIEAFNRTAELFKANGREFSFIVHQRELY